MSESSLTIKAGPLARQWIANNGLQPDHIKAIPGAAGGPKWIVLSGLDRFLFGDWLQGADCSIDLIGTSIGAWRFAMAAQQDPLAAMLRFKENYFNETFPDKPSAADITRFSYITLDKMLGSLGAREIVNNPRLRLHTIVAKTHGLASTDASVGLIPGLAVATLANLVDRRLLKHFFSRVLFHHGQSLSAFRELPGFAQTDVQLTEQNLREALMATASIPMLMEGVFNIPGAPRGCYRDGGMIDYHLDIPYPDDDGVILYPHYTDQITPGWLDKHLNWRKHNPENMQRLLMISPSKSFIASLPHQKIPDRGDFKKFLGKDQQRVDYWQSVYTRSVEMAEELADLIKTGNLAARLEPME